MSNGNNSRHKSQALSVWQSNLPEIHESEEVLDIIDKSRSRMESTMVCYRMAVNALSDNYVYTALQQCSATERVEVAKRIYSETMTPELEASLFRSRAKFFTALETLNQRVSAEVVSELLGSLRDLTDLDDRSFLDKLEDVLDHEFTIRFKL
jgi:hypothetical protein